MKKILSLIIVMSLFIATKGLAQTTVSEAFTGATAPGWVLGGSALLTSGNADPSGSGWLRLTDTTGDQFGHAYYDTAYSTSNGFVIEFEYASWGDSGADGVTLFLFDGSTVTFNPGAPGGSLGYANACGVDGLSNAYIGIAFDEYGNFSSPDDKCHNGGPGQQANSVTIRGPGNGDDSIATNYIYLTHNQLPTASQRIDCPSSVGGCSPNRPTQATYYRNVRVTMLPNGTAYTVLVEMQFSTAGGFETVINTYTLPDPISSSVKLGFAGSTGGAANNHEIRNTTVNIYDKFVDLSLAASLTGIPYEGRSVQLDWDVTNINTGTGDQDDGNIIITSTLPAELTYNSATSADANWSCGAVGQNITCTYAGSVAAGANLATVSLDLDITAGTEGNNIAIPATVTGAEYDIGLTNNTTTLNTTIIEASPDLAIAADFLVTLYEGGSTQYIISVSNIGTDDETGPITASYTLPSQLSFTSATSTDPNWNCTSTVCTYSGGLIEGQSLADITLTLAVGGGTNGATVTLNTTVAGVDADNNTANDTSGATRFIYGGSSSGNKLLYIYYNSATPSHALSRVVPTVNSNSGSLDASTTNGVDGEATPWMVLDPAFAKQFIVNGNIEVPICIRNFGSGVGENRDLRVDLRDNSTIIGSAEITNAFAPNNNTFRVITFSVPLTGNTHTFDPGDTLEMRIVNTTVAAAINRRVRPVSIRTECGAGFASHVDLNTTTVINVDNIDIHTLAFNGVDSVTSVQDTGATIYARALISDPFGSADITDAFFRLYDKDNTLISGPTSMPVVEDLTLGEKTFELGFTIPAWEQSAYTIEVTGIEGTEGTIEHTAAITLQVTPELPLISVTKIADKTTADPGDPLTYTMTNINVGSGDAHDVTLDVVVSKYTALQLDSYGAGVNFNFIEGAPASTLAIDNISYSNDDGATYTYTPTSGAGGAPANFDGLVTNIRIEMLGVMPPTGTFDIEYQMQLE